MNLAIPRENNTELLFYLWKIIDLPYIPLNNLLYKISYELFLLPPDKAENFVKTCLDKKLLIENNNGKLSLSSSLNKRFLIWQRKRKNEILQKRKTSENIIQLTNDIEKDETSSFSVLIKSFVEKGTLNRAANILDTAFEIEYLDTSKGVVKSTVLGSREEPYYIEIDINNKYLKHNCHDFETRRSKNKQFCKHILKFFLLLRERNDKPAEFFLKKIVNDIDQWEFST
ncbi:MAG: hypothetical protein ACFFA0_13810 [Promethearchaeota archaeon]